MALNAKNVKGGNGGGNRVQQAEIEIGNYPARLVQIIDMGVRPVDKWDEVTKTYKPTGPIMPHIMLSYELGTEFMKDEEGNDVEGKPRWISEEWPLYNLKSDKATTTKRYNVFDAKHVDGGDWVKQAGKACTVTIIHTNKGKAKIGGVTPPMKGMVIPELANPIKIFDTDEPDMEIFGSLPEWVQLKIKSNVNFVGSPLDFALNGGKVAAPNKGVAKAAPVPEPAVEEVDGEEDPW